MLTHRTTEMRASLEPKEQQIESLKDQLLHLEKVFEKQMKNMNHLEDELSKRDSKIKQIDAELAKQKAVTNDKQKTIFKIVNDIHKYVQSKDEKSYVAGLMQLNQDYVMPRITELLEKKKKDPETIEELDRQLRYMERSIATLKVNTIKNETRTKNDIKKRTQENTQLIADLNELRIEKRRFLEDIDKLKRENETLNFELKKRERADEQRAGGFVSLLKIKQIRASTRACTQWLEELTSLFPRCYNVHAQLCVRRCQPPQHNHRHSRHRNQKESCSREHLLTTRRGT